MIDTSTPEGLFTLGMALLGATVILFIILFFFPNLIKRRSRVWERKPPTGAHYTVRFMGEGGVPYTGKVTSIRYNLESGSMLMELKLGTFGPYKEILVYPHNIYVPNPAELLAGHGEIWTNVGLDNKEYPWLTHKIPELEKRNEMYYKYKAKKDMEDAIRLTREIELRLKSRAGRMEESIFTKPEGEE